MSAKAEDVPFAERFITFDPPAMMAPIALLDRDGRAAVLSPNPGRAKLIVLWARWCPACHEEVPRLASARQNLLKARIDIALVNVDEALPTGAPAPTQGVWTGTLPSFFDAGGRRLAAPFPDGRRSPLQPFGMPILFVLDRAAFVRGYVKGPVDWLSPAVQAFFRGYADG